MSTVANLETVHGRLGSIRRSIRTLFLAEGISRIVLGVALFLAATFLLDYLLRLPSGVRLIFLLGGGVWLGYLIIRKVVYRMAVPISDDDLALFVERNHPELQERLISAIQFSRHLGEGKKFNSPELVDAVIADAADAAASLDFKRVIVRRHVGKVAAWAFVVFLLLSGAGIGFQEYSGIYFQRLFGRNVRWPQLIRMRVDGFDGNSKIVARGDDLVILARAEKVRSGASFPSKAWIRYEFDSGEVSREQMTKLGGESFKFEFPAVTGPFLFRIEGGDDLTDDYRVITKNPPTLEEISLWYTYPSYLRKLDTPDGNPEVSGNVLAPHHTKVRFVARSGEALEGAELRLGTGATKIQEDLRVEMDVDGSPRKVRGKFEVVEGVTEYEIVFHGKNGLDNRDPIRFTIKGLVDRTPEITVIDPIGAEFISPVCVRPLEVDTKDDFGIQEVGFEYKVSGKTTVDWTYVAFTREDNSGVEYGETRIQTRYTPGLDVAKLNVQPGDFIHVRFRASDYKDIGQRNVTLSKEYRFEVTSLTELQKKLERDIENIKTELRRTRAREESLYRLVERFLTSKGYADKERLVSTEAGEVRESSLEQSSVTNRIDRALRDIARVRRRGVYNKVFEEDAAKELVSAEEVLGSLLTQRQQPGPSKLAEAHLQEAAKARSAENRRELFRSAQDMQSIVLDGLKEAIRFLDRWSTYQEIIRLTREIWKKQKDINDGIQNPDEDK